MKKSLQLFAFLLFPVFLFGQDYFEPLGGPVGVNVKSSFKDANGVLYTKIFDSFVFSKHLKSDDDGNTWVPVEINNSIQVNELYTDGQGNLYAVGVDSIMYRSDLDGMNWTVVNLPNTPTHFNRLSISPNGNLFFVSFPNLYFSVDQGQSWSLLSNDVPFLWQEIVFHSNGSMYNIGTSSTYFALVLSSDGEVWEPVFIPVPNFLQVSWESVHVSNGGAIYVKWEYGDIGISSAYSFSCDNGENFETLISDKSSSAFLTTNDSEDIFYSDLDKIFMSNDKGQTWTNISSGLPNSSKITHIYIDNDQYIYLSLNNNVLYKSILPSTQITAIDDPMDEPFFSFDITPNPASDFIRFQLKTGNTFSGHALFRIVDKKGRIVKEIESQMPNEMHTVHVHGWAAGVYFLQYVEGGLIRHSEKFVVN